jgi:hypothetical protein
MFSKKIEIFYFKYHIKAIEICVHIKTLQNFFFKTFFHHSLAKYSRRLPDFLIFKLQCMKNYENLLMKSYQNGNATREKIVKAARLNIVDYINKSLGEL